MCLINERQITVDAIWIRRIHTAKFLVDAHVDALTRFANFPLHDLAIPSSVGLKQTI